MGFFDEVSSFFGMGEKKDEGPISVPLPYDDNAGANDPAVQAAQAKFSAACAHEDQLKAREPNERAVAEGRRTEDWMKKFQAAQAEHDRLKAQYEGARTKAEGGDLYEDQKQALYQQFTKAYQKMVGLQDLHVFEQQNPLEKYMDPKFVAEQKEAGLARAHAQAELDQLKRAASAKGRAH